MHSTLRTKGDRVDETVHVTNVGKLKKNKMYKEQILNEIIADVCAMLNTNGGKVMINLQIDTNAQLGSAQLIRILEQTMISIIGLSQTVSKIDFKEDKGSVIILVKNAASIVTTSHNLYLPSKEQVSKLLPWEPPEIIMNIITKKVVEEPVIQGSHCQKFIKGKECGFNESKTCQLKNLKAEKLKRTSLADRMTGKGNKFSCYVSAFANYRGGHMYFGINNEGVVEGEKISNDDICDITKKVEKAINKLIWPEEIDQPKRGEHWEIFFEPVLDKNSKPIPSTFVGVIYIAPCPGGVFTEEPECYQMVEGKVEKMSFTSWKRCIFKTIQIAPVPRTLGYSITWISKWTERFCIRAFCILTFYLNNGELKAFKEKAKKIKETFSNFIELNLIVLLKEIVCCSRIHNFNKANKLLQEFNDLLTRVKECYIFDVLGLYVRAANTRAEGNERETIEQIRDLLLQALAKSGCLSPGLTTVLVFLFAGTMTDRFDDNRLSSPDVLSHNALQHLQQLKEVKQEHPVVSCKGLI